MFNLDNRQASACKIFISMNLHVQAVECHPSCPVCLTQAAACWQRLGPIEDTNVVESKEAPFEDIVSAGILSVYPPAPNLV
jgi:hypothetical protein